jgi:PAS domain S-box-containing protein
VNPFALRRLRLVNQSLLRPKLAPAEANDPDTTMAENAESGHATREPTIEKRPAWLRYGASLLATAAACGVRFASDPIFGDRYPFAFFFVAFLFSAWFGGVGPALLSGSLGYLAGDWLFAAPRRQFGFHEPDGVTLLIYLVLGLAIVTFGYLWRDKQRRWEAERITQEKLAAASREQVRLLEHAHEALRRSEEQLWLVIDLVPHGIFAKDAQGRFIFVNRALAALNGKTPQEMIGRTDLALARDSEQAERFRRDDLSVIESGAPKVIPEEILTDATGSRRTLHTTKIPFKVAETGEAAVLGVAVDITERQQTEEALRRGQEELRRALAFDDAVMSNMGEGLYTVDAEGRVTFMNPAAEKLLGWTLTELRGRKMHDVSHFKHRDGTPFPAEQCASLRVLRDGTELRDFEDVFIRRDGTFFDVVYSSAPLRDGEKITGLVVVFRDVTERKRAETAVRESEEKFRGIFETANEGIWILDADARITLVNPRLAELLGYEQSEMLGRRKLDFISGEDHAHVLEHWERRRRGISEQYEVRFRHRDGRDVWTIMAARPIVEKGVFGGALDMVTDVTERKRAEAELRASEERFRAMADASPALIWVADTTRACTWFNKAWLDFVGRPMEKELGDGWTANVHPEDFERCLHVYVSNFNARQPFEMEYRMRRHDGEYRWLLDRGIPWFGAAGEFQGFIGSCVDITESRLKREELENLVAERTAKLREAVNELEAFSYSIAHDMRAPLRSMQGFSRILSEDYAAKLDATGQDYLRRIMASAARMDRLIVDVLNYSKVVRGELNLQPVNVEKLIDDVLASYPAMHSSNADIRIEAPLPAVLANEAALTQVISNLLGNAVKFVEPGVRPSVRVHAESNDGNVRLWFEDNGIGIPTESQPRLFQMFQRLNRPELYEGTGIGLAIVRKAVERMGGTLGVESEPNKGSRFWVQLRRA